MFVNLRIDLGQGESRGGTKYVFDYIVNIVIEAVIK